MSILNISNDNDIYGCWDGKHIGSWLVAFKFLPFSMEKEKREFSGKKTKKQKQKQEQEQHKYQNHQPILN
jgi:hypothetical protein